MKIVAMIPVKLNNERLPGKNIKKLGDKPLAHYLFDTISRVKNIDETYVFCSDPKVEEYIHTNAKFLKRDKRLDSPETNFTDIFNDFCKIIQADIYVVSHVTSPFIQKETFEKCIDAVRKGDYDSAFSAIAIRDFLWKEDGTPIGFDPGNIPRSQDLEPVYCESNAIFVFKRELFEKTKRRVGFNPYIAEVSGKEAVDINYEKDFEYAEYLLSKE